MHKFDKIDKGFIVAFVGSVALLFLARSSNAASAIGIALFLTTVGAFIAYWGDIIGHHIGKKRLSHFNLRPRQTAVLWTIAAGGASALLTFIILLGIIEGFRTAVLRGAHLVYENRQLGFTDSALRAQIIKARHAVDEAHAAEAAAVARAQSAQSDEQQSVAALSKTVANLQTAGRNLKSALAERDRLQQDNAQARSEVIAEEAQVTTATAKVTDEIAKLKGLMSAIAEAKRIYNPKMQIEQENRLIYDNKQEVGRSVIQNDTKDKIVTELNQFLDRLSTQAQAQGAVKNTETGRAVKVATVEILSAPKPAVKGRIKGPEFAQEKENLDVLADQINSFGEPSVVVIASSIGNSFDKDTVIVQLHPYVNHLVVPKNTVVAKTLVPAAADQTEQIMGAIQSMLVKQVRPYALGKGVIPVQENARDQAQLGDVPLAEIVRTVEEVQALKGDAVISAYVPSDVYSADQLHLLLAVHSADAASSADGGRSD